jgi:hypothetical protein
MSASQGDRVAEKSKEVKLWGGRFEESVTDAVERFTESISYDKVLYKHDIMGSRAHASMLAKQVFSLALRSFWSVLFLIRFRVNGQLDLECLCCAFVRLLGRCGEILN